LEITLHCRKGIGMALCLNTSSAGKKRSEHAESAEDHPRVQGSPSPRDIVAPGAFRALKDNRRCGVISRRAASRAVDTREQGTELHKVHSTPQMWRALLAGRLARA
jgi:hypothetical protein